MYMNLVQFVFLSRERIWVYMQNHDTGEFREEVIDIDEFHMRWGYRPSTHRTH